MPQNPIPQSGDDVTDLMNIKSGDDVSHLMNTNPPQMPNAESMLRSGVSKVGDWLNSSVFGVNEPTPEEIQKQGMPAVIRKGVANLTTPLSLGGEALGGLGLFKGLKYLRGAGEAGEVASDVSHDLPVKPPINPSLETGPIHWGGTNVEDLAKDDLLRFKAKQIDNLPRPTESVDELIARNNASKSSNRLKLSTNPDGTITNKDTGEVLDPSKFGNQVTGNFSNPTNNLSANIPPTKSNDIKLPNDLSNAKPRFNIRDKSYTPNFESDVDKAAFITAQNNPSKRDADYLKFVMDNTGLDENGARQLGKDVKNHVKTTLADHIKSGGEEGLVDVPDFDKSEYINTNSTDSLNPEMKRHDELYAKIGDNTATPAEIQEAEALNERLTRGSGARKDINQLNGMFGNSVLSNPNTLDLNPNTPSITDVTNPSATNMMDQMNAENKPVFDSMSDQFGGNRTNEVPINNGGSNNGGEPPIPPNNDNVARALGDSNKSVPFDPKQKESLYSKVRNAQRTLITSFDFSAPGRQGKGLITHPEYWKSFDDMFKAWGSQKGYDVVKESIQDDPSGLFKPIHVNKRTGEFESFADKAGLDLTDVTSRPEEVHQSKWAEKFIPGVDRSSRAYTAFLNKARADVFKKLVKQAGAENNLPVAQQIADSINVSTGRGKTGFESSPKAMRALNEIFFAPRLMASRVQMYTRVLNPKTYSQLDPVVRKEALRSLLGVVGSGLLVGELGRMAGAEVSNDPTSADFRKIKIGNTRIDNFAGLQQYGVAAAKLLSGQSTSTLSKQTSGLGPQPFAAMGFGDQFPSGKFGEQTRSDVATNFLTNKLAPIPSFVWAWMNNKEFDGTPFDAKQAILNRTVPLVIQDLNDLRKEDPNLLPLGILPVMGEGMQTYGR